MLAPNQVSPVGWMAYFGFTPAKTFLSKRRSGQRVGGHTARINMDLVAHHFSNRWIRSAACAPLGMVNVSWQPAITFCPNERVSNGVPAGGAAKTWNIGGKVLTEGRVGAPLKAETQAPGAPASFKQKGSNFRDAKTMAQTLRAALAAKSFKITVSQSLDMIAKVFGVADWNTLAAAIRREDATLRKDARPPPYSEERFFR